tara:strand:- start:332 stop:565 length:234 start_codon:yes stop_codon:yes gene_type:complete
MISGAATAAAARIRERTARTNKDAEVTKYRFLDSVWSSLRGGAVASLEVLLMLMLLPRSGRSARSERERVSSSIIGT